MKKICFNKNWRFAQGKMPFIYFSGGERKISERMIDLPHDFMIEQKRDPNSLSKRDGGYFPGGVGYYNKDFFVPEDWRGKNIYVEFEGVYMNAEIKLNGNTIKRQNYGYTTFNVHLNKYLKYGEENTLSVTVDNSAVPNSRWYSGAGIYRYVWLYIGENSHIDINCGTYITTKSVENNSAIISIQTNLSINIGKSFSYVEYIIADLSGNTVTDSVRKNIELRCSGISLEIEINNVKLWDIDSPNLYKLITHYYENDKIQDTDETIFGVRTFSVDTENGFMLNGKELKLKGGCVHHDNGILGSASYARSEERKIEILKASGFNAVRTAHNPPSRAFLDACDRLGMIVMDESFDQWRCAKTQFDYHINFDAECEHDLKSMILRDRNHPSILFWSIGNEIVEQTGGSSAAETSKMLAEIIRKYDTGRPVGMAYMGFDSDNPEISKAVAKVVEPLDFVGYNYMYHIYEKELERYPERLIIGTETVPKEIYKSWEATLKYKRILGDFVWTAIDYLGEAGIGRVYYTEERPEIEAHLYDYPWNQAYCGDIDVCGFKRPQSYYRDILWGVSDKPKMFVRRPSKYSHESERVTFWGWNDGIEGWDFAIDEGKEVVVDVYSPAKSIKLYLNGELIGEQDISELKAAFTVPYKKGELKAVDSNCNSVVLSTSKTPAQIKLTADRADIKADGDLAYITVEITDEDGKTVTNAENKIYFSVEGAGKLIAAGSSNPQTEEDYAGNFHSAYDGRLMAVVKSTGSGKIILNAIADGLKKSEIILSAE